MSVRNDAAAMIEPLEPRKLLSASLAENVLTVVGTHKNDVITVTINARTTNQISVSVNGAVQRFLLSDVQEIDIIAGRGNDFVYVDPHQPKLIATTKITGGDGKDTIQGGAGKDRIEGNDGNDIIDGGGGRDIIYGGAGNDKIDGNDGNDFIDGGTGNDTLIGGKGIDNLFGNDGDDKIDSEDKDIDSVNGGNGDDFVQADKLDGLTSVEHVNPHPNPFAP